MSKSRLASILSIETFAADEGTATFIAYYTARCHVRSKLTNTALVRPYNHHHVLPTFEVEEGLNP